MGKVRYYWVDWMKVLGMFLIVWGHFFPKSFCDAIYSFNVPLFFCISGYLGGGKIVKVETLSDSIFGNMCYLFDIRHTLAI